MANIAWDEARRRAERDEWLITASEFRALGITASEVSTKLRAGHLVALLRGVYLFDPDLYDELPLRTAWRAALKVFGDCAALAGRTGARAMGLQGLPSVDPAIELVVDGPVKAKRHPASNGGGRLADLVIIRQWPTSRKEFVLIAGLQVRQPRLTVIDAALQLERANTLGLLDSALHNEVLSPEELDVAVAAAKHRPGCRQLREMAAIADGRAESPLESRVRLACIDGNLAPDDLQYEVQAEPGLTVAVGDLAWYRERRRPLIGECDGADPHSRLKPLFRDRRRGNNLTGLSCDTVRFVWEDSMRPAYVQWVVRTALRAA